MKAAFISAYQGVCDYQVGEHRVRYNTLTKAFERVQDHDATPEEQQAVFDLRNAEWNAGAAIADDYFCPSCGRRGHFSVCRWCEEL